MSVTVAQPAQLFTGEEPGFELEGSAGVTVHPLMTAEGGAKIDVFYLLIEEGREVTPESHPFSETLLVTEGTLACSAGGVTTPSGPVACGTWRPTSTTTSATPALAGPWPRCSSECEEECT